MKTFYIQSFFYFLFSFVGFGQNPITFRDVYNFDIGDEFQSKTENIPPNAQRLSITSKSFSQANDTVFYTYHYDNYYSVVDYSSNPPHLNYYFSQGDSAVFYTNLDSTLNEAYFLDYTLDSCNTFTDSTYYDEFYCNNLAYNYIECISCCFEGQNIETKYGVGLGIISKKWIYAAENINQYSRLFYFKKDTIECGTIDSYNQIQKIQLDEAFTFYPNPTKCKLNSKSLKDGINICFYNYNGLLVYYTSVQNNEIDISTLPNGIYFLEFTIENTIYREKIIIQ